MSDDGMTVKPVATPAPVEVAVPVPISVQAPAFNSCPTNVPPPVMT